MATEFRIEARARAANWYSTVKLTGVTFIRAVVGCGLILANSPAARPSESAVAIKASRVFHANRDDDRLIGDLERRTFGYFWDTGNRDNGLVPDRYPPTSKLPSFASIAAVGFGLTAYVIGAERGYITRAQARERTVHTLRFLAQLRQGPEEQGNAGYHGFYYHFLYMENGARYGGSELSTVDTSLLLGGVLLSGTYFDRNTPAEREIRDFAEQIYRRVDWTWSQNRPPAIASGWRPETGFLRYDWRGYNEATLVYILALGSPTHAVESDAWSEWTRTNKNSWGTYSGQEFLSFGPLFGHQYSHVWIDFRGIYDAFARGKGIDYFENSRRAVYANQEYARENPMRWRGYDSKIWGLSACDGPADTVQVFDNEERGFFTYAGRGTSSIDLLDDGTIAPTAAVGSIAFAPEIVIPTIRAFRARFGGHLYQKYGFLDAVNPSFTYTSVPLLHGHIVENVGWVDSDYLGIDEGPILAMIENYRSGLIWKLMHRNPHIRRGLERAGFTGGWLDRQPPRPQS